MDYLSLFFLNKKCETIGNVNSINHDKQVIYGVG